ncbi:MAG: helix-turn-helix domain-containing protein [Alphaproteobacteria bacterium]|nr:helix-turn-helix domain-containing protein [Alphaproteobacteria bacterium]
MSLAAKLKELRIRKGESLQEIADAIGVSKTHVWELETGRSTNPTLELIKKYADHFKVSVQSLVGEDINNPNEDENLVRMFRQANQLDNHGKDILDDMLQSLLKRMEKHDKN